MTLPGLVRCPRCQSTDVRPLTRDDGSPYPNQLACYDPRPFGD